MERHPSEMTPGELLCLREALGLTVRALSHATGLSYQTITRWESESGEWPISRPSAERMADLVAYTNETVAGVVATHPPGSTIVIYRRDKAFREHVNTGDWVLSAAWHRMVAWRAAERIPGATVTYRD